MSIEAATIQCYSIVGVVGHIDHGKTSLVAALTGIETDTHPEEKQRGITIDLGFAHMLDQGHQFAFIDAPGHQKYIGNLLAGVSMLDIGLLVVAADQGIQEQTLEHVSILQTLGVRNLLVVISRSDLVESAKRDELAEELMMFLGEYGFSDFPIVHASTVTGEGLEEVRAALRAFPFHERSAPPRGFRMPVDRVFSVPGRGCVVTGIVWSGEIRIGDSVEVIRCQGGKPIAARVREVESHDRVVEVSELGRRTALNLSGVSANDIRRGDELIAPNSHRPSQRLLVEISMFADAKPLSCPATVSLHTATNSCEARIVGVKQLQPSQTSVAIIEPVEPIVATFGQRFLLRRPYPVGSFAGGRALRAVEIEGKAQKRVMQQCDRMADEDPQTRLQAWVDSLSAWEPDNEEIRQWLGVAPSQFDDMVKEAADAGELIIAGATLISNESIIRSRKFLLKLLAEAGDSEDAWIIEDSLIERARSTGPPALIKLALEQLVKEKLVVRLNRRIALASDDTRLSKRQRAKMNDMLGAYRGNRTPPSLKELAQQLNESVDMITSLARFATQQHLLTDLEKGLLYDTEIFESIWSELKSALDDRGELTVSEIREIWEVSRKFAIPLLEYFDRNRRTVRSGDVRRIGKEWQ